MFEIVKKVIVKWDPIFLMDFAPPDEYDTECIDIVKEYNGRLKPLKKIIYDVFINAFGDEFKESISECTKVADEIENLLKDHN